MEPVSPELSKLLLQVLAVLLGGSGVQLIFRLISRRADLRKTSTESDSVVVKSAGEQVVRLNAEIEQVRRRCDETEADLRAERDRSSRALAAVEARHAEAMSEAQANSDALVRGFREENRKLNRQVSRLQLDLAAAQSQIRVLESRIRPTADE